MSKAVYVDRLPPCNKACPAGENIQVWLALAKDKKFRQAWEEIKRNNPMPAVHGRVCYHPCEANCNRQKLDETMNINAIERFLGDMGIAENWQIEVPPPASGKRVLVVGAGPAGLSAAYHLRLLGHDVTIYEASSITGGMMHVGIPHYRLPREILDAEIKQITDMGVKIELNRKVTDLAAEIAQGKFDAAFLGVGSQLDKWVKFPGQNQCRIMGAIEFLRAIKFGQKLDVGSSIAIYGGGNTAIDAARCAKRLGIKDVTIVYRRDRKHMPAFAFEVDEALEEGVNFKFLRTIKNLDGNNFELEIMSMDDKGKPQPTGQFEQFTAETVVLALGQDCETEFLKKIPEIVFKWDCIEVDDQMMTGKPGIFAGGDMIPYDRSVTFAVGHGKKAARCIDAYLWGNHYEKAPKNELVTYEIMHPNFYQKSARASRNMIDPTTRIKSFAEVVSSFSQEQAVAEAARCMSCGNCFECDTCYKVCPVKAIDKLESGRKYSREVQSYRINEDKCIGCKACYRKCPCAAIDMVE